MTRGDVVVTGMGVTTSLGGDVPTTWDGLLAGRSGVRRIDDVLARHPHADRLPVRIGAPLAVPPARVLDPAEAARLDPVQQAALVAAREAWADARRPQVDPVRLGVSLGTALGGIHTLLGEHDAVHRDGPAAARRSGGGRAISGGASAAVSIAFGARAFLHAPTSACAAGAEAIAHGARMIRAGEADVVIAGGADTCLTPVVLASFAAAGAISLRNDEPEAACRPFDAARDGLVIGEGAGILILERAEFAAARGARALAHLPGAASTADGYHPTSPDPSGDGQFRAMRGALAAAGLTPDDIDHVSCHATSTRAGDPVEALSVHKALGTGAAATCVKAGLGHSMGAAGAVASVLAVQAILHSLVPPTRNLDHPAPGVELDVVTGGPRPMPIQAALCNAFGFGGYNTSLVFTR
ncbi:beta-ketoacyl-[acyl-carrier-protein] synthase family protein [Catenuloplanes sp. NPDC051500]|uniref:beta-ketoacyl-[acyl-carrier-protein] synthase family protein n=1 Tax=Catenuloplanes sp. NPDC051500 TaxID=3363959 RepID=UPI003799F9E5